MGQKNSINSSYKPLLNNDVKRKHVIPYYQISHEYHNMQSVANIDHKLTNYDKYCNDITNTDELDKINVLIQDKRLDTPKEEHNIIKAISLKNLIKIIIYQYESDNSTSENSKDL